MAGALLQYEKRRGTGRRSVTFLGAHRVVSGHTPRAQKIRRPSSGGGKFRGDFSFRRSLSRTSTLAGQGTLPSPTAGCRIRFPESLLMLTLYYANCRVICTSFFGFAMLKKGTEARYRQVAKFLRTRHSCIGNPRERGCLSFPKFLTY